jgi:hypothetical protein
MLIVWGRYAMQHPRAQAGLESCGSCRAQKVERRTVERVWHFMGMPLVPGSIRSATVCTHCKRVDLAAFARGAAPKRLLLWRVVGTWALLATAIVCGVLAASARGDRTHARAVAPVLGDRWVVDLSKWPGGTIGPRYGLLEVKAIDDGAVSLGACDYASSDDGGPPPAKCTTFNGNVEDVRVADVPSMADRGLIVSIHRPGDQQTFYDKVLGACLLIAIVGGLLTWRAARKSWKAGDPLPRAAVVR